MKVVSWLLPNDVGSEDEAGTDENGNFSGYPRMPGSLTPEKIGRFFRPSWGMMVVNESPTFP